MNINNEGIKAAMDPNNSVPPPPPPPPSGETFVASPPQLPKKKAHPLLVAFLVLFILFDIGIGALVFLNMNKKQTATPLLKTAGEEATDASGIFNGDITALFDSKKTLESKACHITLRYPREWTANLWEKGRTCDISITSITKEDLEAKKINVEKSLNSQRFTLKNDSTEQPKIEDLSTVKKAEDETIIIDSALGFMRSIQQEGSLGKENFAFRSDYFYIPKNEMLLTGELNYNAIDTEASKALREILQSIKFTGNAEDYKGDFSNDIRFTTEPITEDISTKNAVFRADFARSSNYKTKPVVSMPKVKWKVKHDRGFDLEKVNPLVFGGLVFTPYGETDSACDDYMAFDKTTQQIKFAIDGIKSVCEMDTCHKPWCTISSLKMTPLAYKGILFYPDYIWIKAKDIKSNKVLWKIEVEDLQYSLSVTNDLVIYIDQKNTSTGQPHYVHAVETSTGKEKWVYEIKGVASVNPNISLSNDSIFIVSGDFAYQTTEQKTKIDGNYHALDSKTGKLKYQYTVGSQLVEIPWASIGDPVYSNGIFVFRVANGMFAINEQTGEIVGSVQITSELITYNEHVGQSIATDGTVYIGGFGKRLFAAKPDLSERLWTIELDAPIVVTPIIAGDYLYTATEKDVIAFNRLSGKEMWRYKLDVKIESDLVIDNGTLFFTDKDYLYALE